MKSLSLILVSVLMTIQAKAQLSASEPSTISNEPVASEPAAELPSTPPTIGEPTPAPIASEPPVVSEPPVSEPPPALEPTPEEPPTLEPPTTPEPLPIVFGEAGYGGTGCTSGNALIDHDDQGRIYILLAPMVLSGNNQTSFGRTACSVRIPVTVPAGMKLAIVEVANQGQYAVDQSDSLSLTQENGFVGADKVTQSLNLSSDGNGQLNWDSSVGQMAESSCEKTDHILALNTNALLRKQKAGPSSSYVSLDSVEVQLTLEPCQ